MDNERLTELLYNVLDWGKQHSEIFKQDLINAMCIKNEELNDMYYETIREYVES